MTGPAVRRVSVGAAGLLALGTVAGAAYGYWGGTGTGSGTSGTGSTVAVTLTPGVPSATLVPGGTAAVVLTVTNPNPHQVRIGSLALDSAQGAGGYAVDAGHTGCGTSTVTYTTQTNGGTGWTVPARVGAVDGSLSVTLPGALAMATSAANDCQGATHTVFLVAGP